MVQIEKRLEAGITALAKFFAERIQLLGTAIVGTAIVTLWAAIKGSEQVIYGAIGALAMVVVFLIIGIVGRWLPTSPVSKSRRETGAEPLPNTPLNGIGFMMATSACVVALSFLILRVSPVPGALGEIRTEINELRRQEPRPMFVASIDTADFTAGRATGVGVMLAVSIRNVGRIQSVAERFELAAVLTDSDRRAGRAYISPKDDQFNYADGTIQRVPYGNQLAVNAATNPIGIGGMRRGWLRFDFEGTTDRQLSAPGAFLEVSMVDAWGTKYTARTGPTAVTTGPRHVFPGLLPPTPPTPSPAEDKP